MIRTYRTYRKEPGWQRFRGQIVDRLVTLDPARFEYMSRDKILGVCPACKAGLPDYLAVTFNGELPAAAFYCSAGCTATRLAIAFRLPVIA